MVGVRLGVGVDTEKATIKNDPKATAADKTRVARPRTKLPQVMVRYC